MTRVTPLARPTVMQDFAAQATELRSAAPASDGTPSGFGIAESYLAGRESAIKVCQARPPGLMAENLRLVAAKTMLDIAGTEATADAATKALEQGVDSPSLRRLAGMTGADSDQVRAVFAAALHELQIARPTPHDAAMLVATEIALRITQGSISPYDGANAIWHIVRRLPGESLPELDTFVYGASEWDDRPEDHGMFAAGIVAAAHDLVRGLQTR